MRVGRYAVPRAVSFPVDEQQRSQQYNPMLSGNMQSNKSATGALAASDSGGARTHPSGNSMGALSGLNRGMTMARPGFQGIASSSMLSSGTTTMPSTVNMQSGVSSNQGNSMSRPRDVSHMIRVSLFWIQIALFLWLSSVLLDS